MQGIIDRFEEDVVVIEVEDEMIDVDILLCEGDLKEGDTVDITLEDGEIIKVEKNEEATESRREYIEDLIEDMWE